MLIGCLGLLVFIMNSNPSPWKKSHHDISIPCGCSSTNVIIYIGSRTSDRRVTYTAAIGMVKATFYYDMTKEVFNEGNKKKSFVTKHKISLKLKPTDCQCLQLYKPSACPHLSTFEASDYPTLKILYHQ